MENCMAEGAATEVENMTCLLVTGEISGLLLKALWGSEGIHGMKWWNQPLLLQRLDGKGEAPLFNDTDFSFMRVLHPDELVFSFDDTHKTQILRAILSLS